jgi:hypothetical protein
VSRAGAACCRPRYLSIQRLNYLWTVWHSSARIQVTCSHSVTADCSLADHGLGGAHHLGHGLRGGRGTPRRWRWLPWRAGSSWWPPQRGCAGRPAAWPPVPAARPTPQR